MSEQQGPGAAAPRPDGQALSAPRGEALTGPGRFAAPQYTGSEYGMPQTPSGMPSLDQAYDRSEYGHYDGQQPYVPASRPKVLPLPDGIGYASWGRRFAAYTLDILALWGLQIPPTVATVLLLASRDSGETRGTAATALILVSWVSASLIWLYQVTWRQGVRGQSWGKQAMGIHLVNANDYRPPGGLIGIARYVVRATLASITMAIYTLVTAYWPLTDIRMRTLDDIMMNTLVVRLSPQRAMF